MLLYHQKRNNILEYLEKEPRVISGYVDSSNGVELTRDTVYEVIILLDNERKMRAREKQLEELEKQKRWNNERQAKEKLSDQLQISKMNDRHRRHGWKYKLPRFYRKRHEDIKRILLGKEKSDYFV